ncbi:ATP-binding protein [Pseudomonas sp. Pseusp16]|uniref:sensor histidine kinase n=1 Tax=Pseudomonas sp. Pseusp16 TaxID=3243021 RepID=UPI0039B66A87
MNEKTSLGTHPFSVEARIAIQLGRESISNSLVAIGELIKNAYDADAEEVIISFSGLGTDTPTLTITDDGDGMDEDTLITKWMRIGTTHKLEKGISQNKNRTYTGAKGLGRLGIDRLCTKLNLFTKTEQSVVIYEAYIDWDRYNQTSSVDLDSIKHDVFKINATDLPEQSFPLPGKNKGSQYALLGLKDDWNYDFLKDLQKELSLLVSPFSKELGFRIKFETNGFAEDLDGYISSYHYLEAAEWRLEAAITDESTVTYKIYDGNDNITLNNDEALWSDWIKSHGETPLCGPLSFKLYFMRNITNKKIDTNKFKATDVRSFLKSNQGVRIYRDHFRVKPYGEPSGEGDWLGLAMRRVINPESITMDNWRIGYNQIVGAVFIGRETNKNLVDQTNREGLTETPAYFALRAFTFKCIELFEKHLTTKAREEKQTQQIEPAVDLSQGIDENVSAYKKILQTINKIKSTADEGTKKELANLEISLGKETEKTASFKERIDQLEAEKDTLANLASLGILSVSFGHETLASISNAIASSELLKNKINDGIFMLPLDTIEFANKRFNQIEKSLNYIRIFGNFSLGNIRRDKRTRRLIDINNIARNVLTSLEEMLEKRKITHTLNIIGNEPKIIKAYEIDWESIFANMITNSCWAMLDTPATSRKLEITINADKSFCYIDFEDSGCGIESGVEDHIFKATFTTKRNKKGEPVGTGMGLSIIKTFIEEHSNGTIELAPKGELGGAKFAIKVPAAGSEN